MIHPPRRLLPLALLLAVTVLPFEAGAQQTVRLPAQDRPLAGRPAALFSIGREEGRSWEMLNNAEQAVFDARENLYVLDRGNNRVLVFGPDGRFLRQVGKKGGGPGEFEAPVGISILGDGSLVVLDLAHRTFSTFNLDGTFRRSVPVPEGVGMPGRDLRAHPQGGVVSLARPMMDPEALRSGTVQSRSQHLTHLSLGQGGRFERLFELPDASQANVSGGATPGGGQTREIRIMGPPTFAPGTHWGVLPGGALAVAHTPDYTVKVTDAAGRVLRQIQRPAPVRRVTERDRERARERRREQLESGRGMVMITRGNGPAPGPSDGQRRAMLEQQMREMKFAETIPPIQGITVTPSGKLWIERTAADVGDPGPIDVVTADGRYLGTITGEKRPAAISPAGRAAYLEVDDELGIERVVVRMLPAAWR